MTRDYKILTTIWFISGLTILLFNDFLFKGLYGNLLTGKISDFAGLFIFPLFWTALIPKHKIKIFWITGLLFIFWKSPYSQFFLEIWNSFGVIKLNRVVDYSDLMALTVLPVAFYIETIKDKLYKLKLTPLVPIIVSAFAFIATVKSSQTCCFNNSAIYHIKHLSRDSLIKDLKHSGLDVTFTEYNGTKYDDEHSEVNYLNDSIRNLVVIINDFNKRDSTVQISLGCWEYMNDTSLNDADEQTIYRHREYVKKVFEENVLSKIERNIP